MRLVSRQFVEKSAINRSTVGESPFVSRSLHP